MSFLVSADGDVVYCYDAKIIGCPEREPDDEERPLGSVMLHKTCGGFVDVRRTSDTANVMLCRACGLRVTIPTAVKTFGRLRQYLANTSAAPAPTVEDLVRMVVRHLEERTRSGGTFRSPL